MSELSPKARALIQASRKALRPTEADRERIETALQSKLGTSALSAPGAAATGSSWQMIAGLAIGVCLIGAAAFRSLQSEPRPQPTQQSTRTESAAQAPQPDSATRPLQPPAATTELSAAKAEPRLAARPSARDHLALEVELLSRATSALRVGNFNSALSILEEHRRKFPRGTLQLERSVAKAQALCGVGRVLEGRAVLDQLPASTPAAARARQSCGL